MSKQWTVDREEFKKSPAYFNKPCNPRKFKELYDQLFHVCKIFPNEDNIRTLARSIMEEIVNIIEHNNGWNTLHVRTEINSSKTRFKAEIIYDDTSFHDPMENDVKTIMGSVNRFEEYNRDLNIEHDPPKTMIRINIKPSPNIRR